MNSKNEDAITRVLAELSTDQAKNPDITIDDEDLWLQLQKLEYLVAHEEAKENYLSLDIASLIEELESVESELNGLRQLPQKLFRVVEVINEKEIIVTGKNGLHQIFRYSKYTDCEPVVGDFVGAGEFSCMAVESYPALTESRFRILDPTEIRQTNFREMGGLDAQKQELQEVVEWPFSIPEKFKQLGIEPPSGVLLYGPPGCGKTMMARAIASKTRASFINVIGSEVVSKRMGEGPQMMRDIFRLAKENSPSIIFIDDIDAIATKRFDAQTGADREVQRILLELLNQMDGFDQSTNVKVIMATNRKDVLDPALLRPGRLDRKIEFPMPDRRQKRLVFSTITAKMNLSDDVDLEDFVTRPDKISCADVNSICQEAGMHAVRENRYVVLAKDFDTAYKNVVKKDTNEFEFYK